MFTDIAERRAVEQALRERDAAEIRAAESRTAQRRIVESADRIRRQVARDLHDGAQQRLVNLLVELERARDELSRDPALAGELLQAATAEARATIHELRELAAGIHPSLLATHGLVPALDALAARAAVPVKVTGSLEERLPQAVEANAYFFVAEALTNAVEHARASRVLVTVAADAETLCVEVRDDGAGGAVLYGAGSGLAGLEDRIGALDGRLVLDSPPGAGTTLRAEIPLGFPAG